MEATGVELSGVLFVDGGQKTLKAAPTRSVMSSATVTKTSTAAK